MNPVNRMIVPAIRRLIFSTVLLPAMLALTASTALAGHPDSRATHVPAQQHWPAPAVRRGYPPVVYVYRQPVRVYAPVHSRPVHQPHRGGHFYGCGHRGHYPAVQSNRGGAGLWVDGVWIAIGAHHR